ncbi:hypothetical protein GcM3_022032 [Golovinomyces cichoracearum]|uniref:HAT C-terminal dimerisation domain-containing protein n=1 Tax=Golovinomyces cichoracearum TaxID=62708 RepID=A0A420J7E0_9PEZI|nr:hypothetical protein GcM3_022032 [Golovinomyces cichoracearum]
MDEVSANTVVESLKNQLGEQYPWQQTVERLEESNFTTNKQGSIEARVLRNLQPLAKQRSDIDQYFKDPIVTAHKGEFPQMAAATRDYLTIPASEVAVKRLFNTDRELIELRRYALSAEKMRQLMLLRSMYN